MIKVRVKLTDWIWVAPLKSEAFALAMANRGVVWSTGGETSLKFDLDFVDARFFAGEICQAAGPAHKIERPTVVFDGRDYAATSPIVRRLANSDDVLAIVKPQAYTSVEFENAAHYEETIFGARMLDSMSWRQRPPNESRPLPEAITEDGFAKIVQFNNFIFSDHAAGFDLSANDVHNRPIDVLFLGSARHYWGQTTREHRAAAHEAIRRLPSDVVALSAIGGTNPAASESPRSTRFGHLPHRQAHFHLMQLAKIVVSPFGFAEVSTREIESQLAGCCIIKPQCDYIRSGPFDYWPAETTEFVGLRFEDLTEKVEMILGDYRNEGDVRRRWSKAKIRAAEAARLRGNVDVCADFYSQLLKGLLS